MIAGKVVAVTGASSGIGEATAEYLARGGAKLVLGARGADKLVEVCRRIVDAGGKAESVAIDVARREDVALLVARAQERFGRLDVLINNAGVMPIGKLDDLAVDDWERMVDVNIKGVTELARHHRSGCRARSSSNRRTRTRTRTWPHPSRSKWLETARR